MEIKKDNNIVITGKDICKIVGVITGLSFLFWLMKTLFSDYVNFPILIGSALCTLILFWYAQRK